MSLRFTLLAWSIVVVTPHHGLLTGLALREFAEQKSSGG